MDFQRFASLMTFVSGIVVEDCLLLLLNLLKNNASNQNFFKEGSYIQRLTPFLELDSVAAVQSRQHGWSAQKVTNIHLMLQLVRTLVSPSNSQNQTVACQKVMFQSGKWFCYFTVFCYFCKVHCLWIMGTYVFDDW